MDQNLLSPYIRVAMYSTLSAPFTIQPRELFDCELIYVTDGCCRLVIEGRPYLAKKNQIVFLPPGVVHSFHCEGDTDFVQPHIHFDPVYSENSRITPISFKLRENMTSQERALIQTDFFADAGIPYLFTPENPDAFQRCFFHILDTFEAGAEMSLSVKADMLRLLELLLNQFQQPQAQNAPVTHTELNTIKNYIDGNYCSQLSLDFLAKSFYVNKFTMLRRFKSVYGISIIKYYNGKRVAAAKQMLRATNMTVKSIGETLHFTDTNSFSRFFKEKTGVSPLRYRKARQGENFVPGKEQRSEL